MPMSPIRDDDRPKGVNWKPWVLGCIGLPLLLIAGCLALAGGAFFWARSSIPNRTALERARHNPAVVAALGAPLKASFSGNTQFSSSTNAGEGSVTRATTTVPLSGPKGSGILSVVAEKRKGKWRYQRLELTLDKTGQRIDLRTPEELAAAEPERGESGNETPPP